MHCVPLGCCCGNFTGPFELVSVVSFADNKWTFSVWRDAASAAVAADGVLLFL